MGGSFQIRMDELSEKIGYGVIDGVIEFDQAYAHRQHEDLTYHHTSGGPKYLERALFDNVGGLMRTLAADVLNDPIEAMIVAAERVAKQASENAPGRNERYKGDPRTLKNSDHVTVSRNGGVVYDRPAAAPRIGPETIEAINEALQRQKRHYYGSETEMHSNRARRKVIGG